jgi:hypothetical protein
MSRPKVTRSPLAVAARSSAEALRPEISRLIEGKTDGVFRRLAESQRAELVDRLVHAIGFALAGLPTSMTRTGSKLDAWRADIFVGDVCNALAGVGIPAVMNEDPALSHAQLLAKELVDLAGLPDEGDLFHQMQRAKKIKRKRWPDLLVLIPVTF